MEKIQIEYSSDRHRALINDIEAGTSMLELVARHKLTDKTIQRIKLHVSQFKTYEVTLTDGITTMRVADVVTRRDFRHACRHIVRKYSGSFNRLELPSWVLMSGSERIKLVDLRAEILFGPAQGVSA